MRCLWLVCCVGLLLLPHPSNALDQAAPLPSKRVLLPYISKPVPPTFQEQLLWLTNEERAQVGCPALFSHDALNTAAQGHAEAMATQNFFGHINPTTGSTPNTRAMRAGYPRGVAENIAAGQPTPEDVMKAWMNSTGHRANILSCSHRSIGIGYAYDPQDTFGPYYHYWVQDFGTY